MTDIAIQWMQTHGDPAVAGADLAADDGTFEYDGSALYFTIGTTRKQVTLT